MNDLDRSISGELSRRHLLQMLGITATGSLAAACQGGTREQPAAPGKPASGGLFQGWYPFDAPPKGNINLLPGVSESITIGYFYDWILLPGAMYYWASQDYFYLLADPSSELSPDGTTFTYRVRPGLKWSDGKPVTGKDVYTTWCLEYVMANAAFTYVDEITQTDDMTVTFHIKTPAPIAQYYLLRGQIVSNAVYGQFLAEAEPFVKEQTPTSDKRAAQLVQKVSAFKPEKVTASGPFTFDMDKLSTQQLTLVKNPRGYLAKQVKFDRATVHTHQGINVLATLALSGKIDYGTGGWPVTIEKELEKKGLRIIRPPCYSGPALFINHGKLPEFADKRVRHALAHAIDRAQQGRAALGESGKDVQLVAGFSDLQVPQWLSDADLAKLNKYEYDQTEAAALLTAVGWKKTGGSWMTPQGKPAAYTLIYPSQFPDWASAAQNLESQLTRSDSRSPSAAWTWPSSRSTSRAGSSSLRLRVGDRPETPTPQRPSPATSSTTTTRRPNQTAAWTSLWCRRPTRWVASTSGRRFRTVASEPTTRSSGRRSPTSRWRSTNCSRSSRCSSGTTTTASTQRTSPGSLRMTTRSTATRSTPTTSSRSFSTRGFCDPHKLSVERACAVVALSVAVRRRCRQEGSSRAHSSERRRSGG